MWAHPRVCGENRGVMTAPNQGGGSSPRVRGKPNRRYHAATVGRLIPACAGKTRVPRSSWLIARAHPRVCGENFFNALFAASRPGSSPRVRGKQLFVLANRVGPGLIPACAGKTGKCLMYLLHLGAHPRVCGENFHRDYCGRWRDGSSPRVRGKH